jgi:hypothetical protein
MRFPPLSRLESRRIKTPEGGRRDFHLAASQPYEDLENTKHTIEVSAATAEANRPLASALDKLRTLALQLADFSKDRKKNRIRRPQDRHPGFQAISRGGRDFRPRPP